MAFLVTPAEAHSADLLFQSDFGGDVHIGTPVQIYHCFTSRGWWPILGGDDGFNWPISINGGSSQGLQAISYRPNVTWNAKKQTIDSCDNHSPIWKAQIIYGTRHDGSIGPMLYQQNLQNMIWQLPYVINPGSDVRDEYQKVWIKFSPDLSTNLGPGSWYTFAEWKDSGYRGQCPIPGYRIAVYIMTDKNGIPFWDMHGDNCPSGSPYWDKVSRTAVPVGRWISFEWAWHRTHDNSSWTWVKVDGIKIFEQVGGGNNSNGFYNGDYSIDRIFVAQMYGAHGQAEQWIDHIEIWDGVPHEASP
jgi:hypothetical protein